MFANTQMGGVDTGGPDVCLTPAPPAPAPVPLPYPNIANGPVGAPPVPKILMACAPAHNMSTKPKISNGDNVGVSSGVVSGRVMGPTQHVTASFTVLLCGMPGTKMTSVGIQNGTNCPGARIAPSQAKVLLLAP